MPLLGAYAAKQCPYRLFREYDPTEPAVPAPPDDSLQQLFDDGIAFEVDIVEEILDLHPGDAVAIPGRDEADHDHRRALTDAALAAGTPIILGALMQPDVAGRRMAEIDLLVATGRTTGAGKAEYRAIDVKSHRCTVNDPDGEASGQMATSTTCGCSVTLTRSLGWLRSTGRTTASSSPTTTGCCRRTDTPTRTSPMSRCGARSSGWNASSPGTTSHARPSPRSRRRSTPTVPATCRSRSIDAIAAPNVRHSTGTTSNSGFASASSTPQSDARAETRIRWCCPCP